MNYQGFDNIVDFLQMKLQELPLQPHGIIYREAAEYLADALSAAGIGDVSEWKHRAEVAERDNIKYGRALYNLAVKYVSAANIWTITADDGKKYLAEKEICGGKEMKRLCRDCPHCKGTRMSYISFRYWCGLTGDGYNGKALGVYPWKNKTHPKCPLKEERKDD